MIRIYIASKAKHGRRWKRLRDAGCPIVSTWIDESEPGETLSWSNLWTRSIEEASSATAMVVYHECGETPRGALVEIGAALAHGVPVYVVGSLEHTWLRHPLVQRFDTLEAAMYAAGWPPSANDSDDSCTHPNCLVEFDAEAAAGLDEHEVRRRWPRFEGYCMTCGQQVIKYASFEHYIAGDW